jgi:hypothetical protein
MKNVSAGFWPRVRKAKRLAWLREKCARSVPPKKSCGRSDRESSAARIPAAGLN